LLALYIDYIEIAIVVHLCGCPHQAIYLTEGKGASQLRTTVLGPPIQNSGRLVVRTFFFGCLMLACWPTISHKQASKSTLARSLVRVSNQPTSQPAVLLLIASKEARNERTNCFALLCSIRYCSKTRINNFLDLLDQQPSARPIKLNQQSNIPQELPLS